MDDKPVITITLHLQRLADFLDRIAVRIAQLSDRMQAKPDA